MKFGEIEFLFFSFLCFGRKFHFMDNKEDVQRFDVLQQDFSGDNPIKINLALKKV
jgi:hypothetical protein